jgi:hypothetical protein
MSTTTNTTAGGFAGDSAEAFRPPTAGGCCGSPAAADAGNPAPVASTCCGTAEAAASANSCCDPAAKADAVAAGAGCCG